MAEEILYLFFPSHFIWLINKAIIKLFFLFCIEEVLHSNIYELKWDSIMLNLPHMDFVHLRVLMSSLIVMLWYTTPAKVPIWHLIL